MTLPVIVNRNGGTADSLGDELEARLRDAFARVRQRIELSLVSGRDIADAVRKVADRPRIVVGGGDGTLSSAAGVLAGRGAALAILPLGTRNHFARQLDLPPDLEAAAAVAVNGDARAVDLGGVGERIFINNVSVGLYPRLVLERERHGGPKWLGSIPAAWRVLRHLRSARLKLALDGEHRALDTPLLFVGNNRYLLARGRLGERESLTGAMLAVYALPPLGPARLAEVALSVLLGRANDGRGFELLTETRCLTMEGEGRIEVAVDGDVACMTLPLRFETRPAALRVVGPRSEGQNERR